MVRLQVKEHQKPLAGSHFPSVLRIGTYTQVLSANQDRDCRRLSRSAGFLIIFFLVKALTNINVESRTWLIPLKWLNFSIG
jgi:hypothetical protein